MENLPEDQLLEQSQHLQAQTKRARPSAKQPTASTASNPRTNKRKSPERSDQETKDLLYHPEAPRPTRVHNQLVLPSSSTAPQKQGYSAEPSPNPHEDPETELTPVHHERNQEMLTKRSQSRGAPAAAR